MNLPSTSYVPQSAKLAFSWSNSGEFIPELGTINCGQQSSSRHQSPEIKSEDMDSMYSDAGETFSWRPTCNGFEDHGGTAGPSHVQRTDANSRDFIMKRFLPAAHAMANEASSSASTSTSSIPSDHRHVRDSNVVTTRREIPMLPIASRNRYVHEVKQDEREDSDSEVDEIRACGFPLRMGRLGLGHLKSSFLSCSTSRPPRKNKTRVAHKVQEGGSENSDDLFWSDEEDLDNVENTAQQANMVSGREGHIKVELRKGASMEGFVPGARPPLPVLRSHSMENVHTPDHKGFLGLPKVTGLSGESERARQVDRLGARLSRMISKTNYVESRSLRVNEHEELEGSSQGPSATSSSSAEVQAPKLAKWVEKGGPMQQGGCSLMPPPSPKSPSESWLCHTLPPSRFVEVKKLSRKSLGSYIPIKPPLKPLEPQSREEVSGPIRQSCSLKDHLQGRHILSSKAQAV